MQIGTARYTSRTWLSNTAVAFGGGAYVVGDVSATGATWMSNTAQQRGGALYLFGNSSTPMAVVNSLFAGNRLLTNQGDALYMVGAQSASSLALLHNTLANPSVEDGAAIYVSAGTVALTNTIDLSQVKHHFIDEE